VTILYVQAGLGFSAFDAGLMLLPFSLGAFVGTGVSVPLGLKVGKTVCLGRRGTSGDRGVVRDLHHRARR
jgi:hypothetical protein